MDVILNHLYQLDHPAPPPPPARPAADIEAERRRYQTWEETPPFPDTATDPNSQD